MPAKSKKTTNGGRRCARRETWQTLEVIPQRRFERNVQVDDQGTAARVRKNQTQKIAKKKAALKIGRSSMSGQEVHKSFVHSFCSISITCFKGSTLTLLVPVKGWSRTYIKNKINVIVTVSVAVSMYCVLMFFIPKK